MKRVKLFIISLKKFLLCRSLSKLALIFIVSNGMAQGFPDNPTQINDIPASPSMWEFEKYGQYPVSMYTGVPNISIPVYTAKSGRLSIPISVSYHASGIKVDQKATWVGLGWMLNAGGAITRTVRGSTDESGYINNPDGYKAQGTIDPYTDYQDIEYMKIGSIDTEPDIYNYSFLGYSGSFIYNHSTTITNAVPINLSQNDLKIKRIDNDNFEIITPEGVVAQFGNPEQMYEHRMSSIVGSYTVSGNSTWHLKKLTAANGIDTIVFEYRTVTGGSNTIDGSVADERYSDREVISYPDPCWLWSNSISNSTSVSTSVFWDVKKIDKIIFNNGYIKFNASDNNRLDDPSNEESRLDNIEIYSSIGGVNSLIKTFKFEYQYFGTYDSNFSTPEYTVRLKLWKILEEGSNSVQKNPHIFSYNTSMPKRFNKAQDYWGYYNGGIESLLPQVSYDKRDGQNTITLGSANRDVNPSLAQAGVINKITYPTLGSTEFEFESNTATVTEGSTPVQYTTGGLRIKTITNFDHDGSIKSQKSYEYTLKSDPTKSSGVYNAANMIKPEDYLFGSEYYFNAVDPGSCGPIGGTETWIKYSDGVASSPSMSNNFATVFYSEVKEYNGTPYSNNGYKWYKYETTKDDLIQGLGPVSFTIDRSWDRGQILNEETYELGNPNPIASISNVYEEEEMHPSISGYKAGTRFDIGANGMVPTNQDLSTFRNNYFFLTYYNTPVIWKRLKSTTRIQDGVSTTTEYFYNTNKDHIKPIKTRVYDSHGKTVDSKTYYPKDITSISSLTEGGSLDNYQFITDMKDNHQINTPIQSVALVDGVTTNIQRNIFQTKDGIIVPKSIQTAKGNSNVEDRVLYSNYKNGKLVEVKKAEGAKTSYIWGYNNQYPVAKIENASYSEIETVLGSNFDLGTGGLTTTQANNLRSQLTNSLVTTYVYEPLIGVTSITDPKGYTSTFVYDEFNRLKYTKDHDGNILSKNDYHYKAQ